MILLLWLVPLAGMLLVGHDLSCRIWPLRKCRACGGRKKYDSPTGRNFRLCAVCVGKGHQRRRPLVLGRR